AQDFPRLLPLYSQGGSRPMGDVGWILLGSMPQPFVASTSVWPGCRVSFAFAATGRLVQADCLDCLASHRQARSRSTGLHKRRPVCLRGLSVFRWTWNALFL